MGDAAGVGTRTPVTTRTGRKKLSKMRLTAWLSKASKISYKYSNLPESYIERAMKQVAWVGPKGLPQYLPVELGRKKFRYTMNRPWTEEFRRQNAIGTYRKKVFVEPIKEWSSWEIWWRFWWARTRERSDSQLYCSGAQLG